MAHPSVAASLALMIAGLAWTTSASAQAIPADAKATATVPAATFASWFETGSPSLNGVVNPANSVTFSNNPGLKNVDFYQWSEQMFLWLTSPTPPRYGGGSGRIFSSPVFFDVSPPDASGNRTFIPHVNGRIRRLNLRTAQPGPHGLPVIMSKAGRMFEIAPARLDAGGKSLLLNGEGKPVTIGRMTLDSEKKLVFLDDQGKTIVGARPILPPELNKGLIAQKLLIDKSIVFLDPSGKVIDTEEGQAGGNGVLLTQSGSLIYYSTIVNDVYAYFLTGTKDGGITPAPTQFPTAQADLNKIVAFAGLPGPHKTTFPDPEALCVELKTSWVETAGLPNAGTYITTTGTVPTYDRTDPKHWVANGQKTVELALVGMHVVGSANGHPEMIWASFEHFGNSPNAAFTYNPTAGPSPKTIAQDTSGTWLFCATGASGSFNNVLESASGADILSTGVNPIGPGNILREHPFGGASNQDPNPLVGSIAESNTQVISMNNSVLGQLVGGDLRKNYFFLGATWTEGGAAPSASFPSGNVVGTSQLSNTTMETFQQGTATFGPSQSCFGCHSATNASGNPSTGISHVFNGLAKLF
jgi:hypothetical protein